MRYNTIRQLDIANGPGCRASLFVQGCTFNCPGCFNEVAKDFDKGTEFTEQTLQLILELLKPSYISGLSILGGEPLHPRNRTEVLNFAKEVKKAYPNKTIWLWTGYLWEDVAECLTDSGIDVIVDGQFKEDLKDLRLKYRGSSNQRIIKAPESIENKTIILYE